MKKIILQTFCILLLLYFSKLSATDNKSSSFRDSNINQNTIEIKKSIYLNDIKIEVFSVKIPLDLRNSSVFSALGLDHKNIYNKLTPKKWLVGICEIIRAKGANGLNREWKGNIPDNLNVNIFIPAAAVNGNVKYLHTLLHRIIPLAIYKVIKKEIENIKGKHCAASVKLKWINDIIINGKKICGVKPDDFGSNAEIASFQFGLNTNMPKEHLMKIDQPATSLSVECGKHIDRQRIFQAIIKEIIELFKQYKCDEFGLDNEFSSKMAFIGESVIVYDYIPGKNIEGILEKISGGRLYIRNAKNGKICCILPGYGKLRHKKSLEK